MAKRKQHSTVDNILASEHSRPGFNSGHSEFFLVITIAAVAAVECFILLSSIFLFLSFSLSSVSFLINFASSLFWLFLLLLTSFEPFILFLPFYSFLSHFLIYSYGFQSHFVYFLFSSWVIFIIFFSVFLFLLLSFPPSSSHLSLPHYFVLPLSFFLDLKSFFHRLFFFEGIFIGQKLLLSVVRVLCESELSSFRYIESVYFISINRRRSLLLKQNVGVAFNGEIRNVSFLLLGN